jgi:hypothetical protein
MTRSKRDGGTPGNAARKKPRGVEKEPVLEVDRGEASGDVASVRVEGAEDSSYRSTALPLSELPSTLVLGGDRESLMSCSSMSAPAASSVRTRRSLRRCFLVNVSGSRSERNAAMRELSKEVNSS